MATATPDVAARERLQARGQRELYVPIVSVGCAVVLALAFLEREELWLRPEDGLGYALGIAGLSCMVLLLGYVVIKRSRPMRRRLPLRHAFRIHMLLGVLGPTAILLHSNFSLGSRNSSVALASMLLVAGSGYVGRFVYARIHRGIFGSRRHLEDLRFEVEASHGTGLAALDRAAPELSRDLDAFEQWVLDPMGSPMGRFLGVGRRRARLRRRAVQKLGGCDRAERRLALAGLDEFLGAAQRVARFRGWERVFSWWHAVHLPLCFLLFGAAAVHVLAVHLY
ncbi:MAG: hypothetical protein QNK05_17340 [Myxococcota bacterium]|nr:hypothetical protein [Myxococcota bacterium]